MKSLKKMQKQIKLTNCVEIVESLNYLRTVFIPV